MNYLIIAVILVIAILVIAPYLSETEYKGNSRSWEQPQDELRKKLGDVDLGIAMSDLPEWYTNPQKAQRKQTEPQRALPKPDVVPIPKFEQREKAPVRAKNER